MIVRFGYVAMSMTVHNASPSKTMTATRFFALSDREAGIRKLELIAWENLHNTLRLLKHNKYNEIELYRFSSRLIPLVGHDMLPDWDPIANLADAFMEVGKFVKENGMRTSFHPDHFTVLSTPRKDVLKSSVEDLTRHVRMLESMGLGNEAKCNIHVGGAYGNKKTAGERFVGNFSTLSERIQKRLTLENDDKTFTARETLEICEKSGVPMVLDIHHHQVNNEGETYADLWPRVLATWAQQTYDDGTPLPPKIHVSSPKSEKDPRSHADYVDVGSLLAFLREIAPYTDRLDVMIEAKMKDEALIRLMQELHQFREEGVQILTQASIEIKP